jgi:hypothetical protein
VKAVHVRVGALQRQNTLPYGDAIETDGTVFQSVAFAKVGDEAFDFLLDSYGWCWPRTLVARSASLCLNEVFDNGSF